MCVCVYVYSHGIAAVLASQRFYVPARDCAGTVLALSLSLCVYVYSHGIAALLASP